MKAIRVKEFGGPEVLRLEEVPTLRPGPDQVLVRMHAIGINPVETYIRAGTYARLPELPYIPGNDGAGVVEQVDADVSEFKAGDHVYTAGSISGTYAEFALCEKEQVHPLPSNISFAQGAAIVTQPVKCCRKGFETRILGTSETLGCWPGSARREQQYGIGGRGIAIDGNAVEAPRNRGAKQLLHDARRQRGVGEDENQHGRHVGRDHARALGDAVDGDTRAVDLRRGGRHLRERVGRHDGAHGLVPGTGAGVLVNLGKDLTILAKGGRVVIIGSRGRVEIDPRDTMQRDADIRGMVLPNTPPAELASIHAALVAGLENGTLRPVIGKEFPLAEAAQAHQSVMESGALGKIVLRTSEK